ncbi:glycosyltransferase [Candidatus Peregrinibacteria bacterium]|nr:glycosyltransferase [Candidatus Peregrinibacteria bacterium]
MTLGIDCRMYSSSFTGIGRYTHEIVDFIIKENAKKPSPDTVLLFMNDPEYKAFKTSHKFVKKIRVNARHYSIGEQTKFLWLLKKHKPDKMFFPHFNVPYFYNGPYIVTIHDLTLSLFPGKKLNRFYHRLAYKLIINNAVKRARKIIAVSENTKKDIITHLKAPEDKIKVIHNGISDIFKRIPHEKTKATLKKYDITSPFLLYTGVWRNHKNIPRLIEALSLVHRCAPDLKLVITGKKNPLYPEINQSTEKFGLTDSVVFTGHVSEKELNHLVNAATIYVFPSLYEGFGFPPLEAMKCGTPVATSFTSCMPEVCGKKNALYFNPYNVRDIANKIRKLYLNMDLQKILTERGLKHAEKYTWQRSASATYKIINSI